MAFEKTRKKLAEAVKKARLKKAYKKEGMDKKAAKAKAKVKSKAPETGKVRRGAKGVESTKGGEYVKYKKKSKAAKSFRSEFAAARKAGKKAFTWDGRSYSTARADDKKKVAPKKVAPKKAAPKKVAAKEWHPPLADSRDAGVRPPFQEERYLLADSKKVAKPKASEAVKPKKKAGHEFEQIKPYPPREDQGPKFEKQKMEAGGKVESSGGESNPYGWPSRDARNGGKG